MEQLLIWWRSRRGTGLQLAVYLVLIVALWVLTAADWVIPIAQIHGAAYSGALADATASQTLFCTLVLFTFPLATWALGELLARLGLGMLTPLVAAFFGTVTIFMHTSFYFYHWAAQHASGDALTTMIGSFDALKDPMGTAYMIVLGLISLVVLVTMLRGRVFPRALALVNPITGLVVLRLLKTLSPGLMRALTPALIPATMFALLITLSLLIIHVRERRGRQTS